MENAPSGAFFVLGRARERLDLVESLVRYNQAKMWSLGDLRENTTNDLAPGIKDDVTRKSEHVGSAPQFDVFHADGCEVELWRKSVLTQNTGGLSPATIGLAVTPETEEAVDCQGKHNPGREQH